MTTLQRTPARASLPLIMTTTPLRTRDRVLDFIWEFHDEHKPHTPSLRQISAACELSQTNMALFHIRHLVQDGMIEYDPEATFPNHHIKPKRRRT